MSRFNRESVLGRLATYKDLPGTPQPRPAEQRIEVPSDQSAQGARAPFGMRPPAIDRWALSIAGEGDFAPDVPIKSEPIEDARARWEKNAELLHPNDTRAEMFFKLTGFQARGSYNAQAAARAIDAELQVTKPSTQNPYAAAEMDQVFDELIGSKADVAA